jgi:thioredoxin-related protein
MKRSFLTIATSLLPFMSALAAGDGWIVDFEAARKMAAEQKKDLLMDFTGSDWCGWCIRLKKEVFDQEPFQKSVGEHFILVELDFPRDKSQLKPETVEQNEKLGEKYGIQGYPTIILADASGRPYAQTGYQEGGPEKYLEHLADLRKKREQRDKALKDADALKGPEKAKALQNALADLPDSYVDSFYGEVVESIITADPGDETGFKKARDYRQAVNDYEGRMEQHFVGQDFDGAIQEADNFVKEHDPSGLDKQHILMGKAMAVVEKGDKDVALALLDKIKGIAPDSQIGSQIDMMKERVGTYLDQKNSAQPADSQ